MEDPEALLLVKKAEEAMFIISKKKEDFHTLETINRNGIPTKTKTLYFIHIHT